LTGQLNPEWTRRKNIIEMAVDFTTMMRVFSKGSATKIEEKLDDVFKSLDKICTRDHYQAFHRSFCEWFTGEIRTAEKHLRNGKVQQSEPASYGHAAKILDIAVKVYVYYCAQPTAAIAQRVVPFLNGAVDTAIMQQLKSEYPSAAIRATTLKEVDQKTYEDLQSLLIQRSDAMKMYPVQCEDIMWRQLSRRESGPDLAT
jgi:hypothetical protein